MFRKFAFALVAVAIGISPSLAENGKHEPKVPNAVLADGSVKGLTEQPKGIIAILIGLAKDEPGQTPTGTSMQKQLNKSTPLNLKGAQGQKSTAKLAIPRPVPLKEQIKGRMKSRIKGGLKNGGK